MKAKRARQRASLLLSALLILSLLAGYFPVSADVPGLTKRISDYDTSDSYSGELITQENGTRYAGRVWTDKTVFGENEDRAQTVLEETTDGYSGTVGTDENFLHCYSTLGSSQHTTELPRRPIDLSIILDVSGSMGTDVRYSYNYEYPSPISHQERMENMRITKTLAAVNSAINELMEDNEENKVSVTMYGGTANTILPLDHYAKKDGQDILKITHWYDFYFGEDKSEGGQFGTGTWKRSRDAAFTITADCKKGASEEDYHKAVSNYASQSGENGTIQGDEEGTVYIGYTTNLQAGLWLGMNELANNGTATYTTTNSERQAVQTSRIPVVFVMSDGGANLSFRAPGASRIPDNVGDEWNNLTVPEKLWAGRDGFQWGAGIPGDYNNGILYGNDKQFWSGSGTILEILMTASYLKNKIEKNYSGLIGQQKEKPGGFNLTEAPELDVRTIGVDLEHVDSWQIPRLYATLNPEKYFQETMPSDGRTMNDMEKNVVKGAWDSWQTFIATGNTTVPMGLVRVEEDTQEGVLQGKINGLGDGKTETVPGGEITITNEDVINEINYVSSDKFYDVSATGDDLNIFSDLVREINGSAFNPVTGENDLSGMDMVSYSDPIGEYMEIKPDSVHVDGDVTEIKSTSPVKDYDMAMLLYGQMHGVVEDLVYDQAFMAANPNADKSGDGGTFDSGWYKIQDGEVSYQKDGPPLLEEGWRHYATKEDILAVYPDTEQGAFDNDQAVFYRLAGDPEQIKKNVYFNPGMDESEDTPRIAAGADSDEVQKLKEADGAFTLDEFGIWSETKDGKTVLKVNVPKNALPLEVAEVVIDESKSVLNYKDNIDNRAACTPLRLFYSVGLKEDLLVDGADKLGGVKTELVSDEYKAKHRDGEDLFFNSNLYSENKYTGYDSDSESYRTIGDAFSSFSPGEENRFYVYQKPLFLTNKAYTVGDDYALNPVDSPESFKGGLYLGLYDSDTAFKEAAQKVADQDGMIEDSTGAKYKYEQDGIVLLKDDRLTNIDVSGPEGEPLPGAKPFSGDGYYFMVIDYYKPGNGTGRDYSGGTVEGTKDGETIYRVLARKGSSFGSAYESDQINYSNMLCWYGFHNESNTYCLIQANYFPLPSSGDQLRGRPTLERLTQDKATLRSTLEGQGVKAEYLDSTVNYWLGKQKEIKEAFGVEAVTQDILDKLDFRVATRVGGIRVGDMSDEVGVKGDNQEAVAGSGNKTSTAYNYYVPTISPNSSISTGSSTMGSSNRTDLIINSFLGNNGRLQIFEVPAQAEAVLKVNKKYVHDVEAPSLEFAFNVTEDEGNEKGYYVMPENTRTTITGEGQSQYEPIVFKKEGTYTFYIQEENGGRSGIGYDTDRVKAVVTVSKSEGKLSVDKIEYSREPAT